MSSSSTKLQQPASRVAVSVIGAITLHLLVIAIAWPWIKPFMSTAATGGHQRIDRRAIEAAVAESPIISGEMPAGTGLITDDTDYTSVPWTLTAAISPADARLPFSFATAMNAFPRSPVNPPYRSLIAPARGGPTIRP